MKALVFFAKAILPQIRLLKGFFSWKIVLIFAFLRQISSALDFHGDLLYNTCACVTLETSIRCLLNVNSL